MISKENEKLFEYIKSSPTPYHAVKTTAGMLKEAGFIELDEKDDYKSVIKEGGKYFVTRSESSIIAFSLDGYKVGQGFNMAAAHSDSPMFRVKLPNANVISGKYTRLNVEGYGGMLMAPWFDRALTVAGRLVVRDEKQGIRSELFYIDKDLCVIPSLAIHMNREANKGYEYNIQKDLLPLYSNQGDKADIVSIAADACGVDKVDVVSGDLWLVTREEPKLLGEQDEFILSPRLDDLACAFGLTYGLIQADKKAPSLVAIFDNEEVGSGSRQGADSTFLSDTLERINEAFGGSRSDYLRTLANSFMISADNAHSLHPAHEDKADVTNKVYMNQGVVIKFAANQKYTTDAVSYSKLVSICEAADVPYQTFYNRSNVAGGSTLGNISTSHVSVPSVDIGLAQLSMHSAVETEGSADTKYLVDLMKEYFK